MMSMIDPDVLQQAVLALLGGSALVQLAPIKLNPWTWLAKKVGHALNGELIDKVDKLETAFHERAAKDARVRILRFGDEVLHGDEHSKEHFDQILQDITEYDKYCQDHPDFKNNMTKLTTEQIQRVYKERWVKHDFK